MQLNDVGKLAEQYWLEIPDHFPFVELGNFVIMPNHMHGILIIENSLGTLGCDQTLPNVHQTVTTDNEMSKISPKSGSISTIIRSYKSVVTKNARKIQVDFGWQSRFHDHVIRNNDSFKNIQNYISNNPSNWTKNKFYEL